MGGIDPLVAAFACNFTLVTAILTHGLLLFGRVPIHHWWHKALKSRVVQVKYEKKGLHCCGFRYQHTYNGKLTEGGGNFVCISTVLDLYFLWDWIGRFSRGSNRSRCMQNLPSTLTLTELYKHFLHPPPHLTSRSGVFPPITPAPNFPPPRAPPNSPRSPW